MSEGYLKFVLLEKLRPKLSNLLTLRNGVCCNKSDFAFASFQVLSSPDKPRAGVIKSSARTAEIGYPLCLQALFLGLELSANEGRIAENVRTLLWRQYLSPVFLQRVGTMDMRRLLQRNPRECFSECGAQAIVHDVIHHPQCDFGEPQTR